MNEIFAKFLTKNQKSKIKSNKISFLVEEIGMNQGAMARGELHYHLGVGHLRNIKVAGSTP